MMHHESADHHVVTVWAISRGERHLYAEVEGRRFGEGPIDPGRWIVDVDGHTVADVSTEYPTVIGVRYLVRRYEVDPTARVERRWSYEA